ncbi:hypothetical protein [Streptomyces luteogriseus]|uniref:hypothetical protein n=1 Tax=Streptomyces luteogriseus TaxID=68233 RepID=UPI00378D77AC
MPGLGRLKAAVYVQDPTTWEEVILRPGESPDPEVAVLISHPDAWEEPSDDCDKPDEAVVMEKAEPSGSKAGGQEETADVGAIKKPQTRRSRSSGS